MNQSTIPANVLQFARETRSYLANIRNFEGDDWLRYGAWIGTISSLFFATTAFVLLGHFNGVQWPGYVWNIPIGTGLFVFALAVDDIGHRTLYKHDLKTGEGYVHQMIIVTAVTR